jgi:hypothetical protein
MVLNLNRKLTPAGNHFYDQETHETGYIVLDRKQVMNVPVAIRTPRASDDYISHEHAQIELWKAGSVKQSMFEGQGMRTVTLG